ncbi:MAG: hypothetical protein PHU14_02910 [Methylovulum sp.]|nr:hypothetical protein [Methylovulum sp.]
MGILNAMGASVQNLLLAQIRPIHIPLPWWRFGGALAVLFSWVYLYRQQDQLGPARFANFYGFQI